MSHYAVAVFCDTPASMEFDRLMEPFNEQDEKYFIFDPVSDEEIAERWDKFHKDNPSWEYSSWLDTMFHSQDGKLGYWYNPHAAYDYYTLNGKDYLFDPLRSALEEAGDDFPYFWKKSQIDWFKIPEDMEKYDEAFWAKIWAKYSENGDGFYSDKYYRERFGTKQQFIKEMMRPTIPFAFVTPDGKWHAPGNMGWFACSDETAESMDAYWEEWCDFIKNAPDCYVSILDCHI